MNRLVDHLRANVVAYLALFVALGGSSYAAFSLPAGSVGTSQLKNHSITPIKFNSGKIGAYVRAWAVIQGGTHVIASSPRATVINWDAHAATGDISWGRSVTRRCFPLSSGGGQFAQAALISGSRGETLVHFGNFGPGGQPNPNGLLTFVAVMCPDT